MGTSSLRVTVGLPDAENLYAALHIGRGVPDLVRLPQRAAGVAESEIRKVAFRKKSLSSTIDQPLLCYLKYVLFHT
jgi:hypothetical protein